VILYVWVYLGCSLCWRPYTGDLGCSYDDYFGLNVDTESLTYLTLANYMLHLFYPTFMVTIAEVGPHQQSW